jgi:voltage-gated potassium channel Kch
VLHEDECRLVDRERQQVALVGGGEEGRALGGRELGGWDEVDGVDEAILVAPPAQGIAAAPRTAFSMYARLERWLRNRLAQLTLSLAVGLIVGLAAALATAAALLERILDPEFDTFGSALWFSVTTVSTVGYGDLVPQTDAGKLVATALMLVGLGMIPLITSVVVSILVAERNREVREASLRDLQQILERLDSLERRIGPPESR